MPVDSLFINLESGVSLDEYLDCFPDVTREQAVAGASKMPRSSRSSQQREILLDACTPASLA